MHERVGSASPLLLRLREFVGFGHLEPVSVSIVWGVAGLSGMVAGVRLVRRAVWVGGASLMGIVVVKLFLFDLANTGTVARVVSFLGVGVLLIVVGYFAPVPPSTPAQTKENEPETDIPSL